MTAEWKVGPENTASEYKEPLPLQTLSPLLLINDV